MDSSTETQHNSAKLSNLKQAIYEHYANHKTFRELSQEFHLEITFLKRMYDKWSRVITDAQVQHPNDIQIILPKIGRKTVLHESEENLLVQTAIYFSNLATPLTRMDLRLLVQDMIEMLPTNRQVEISFRDNLPSNSWVTGFLSRHVEIELKNMQKVEASHVTAVTRERVSEHLARCKALYERYHINDGRRIFNIDQTGISFKSMRGRCMHKGIGPVEKNIVTTGAATKGNLSFVTVMPVINAAGQALKPVIVFPGVQPHWRRVNGNYQLAQDFLPDSHYFQRSPAGVNSQIFFEWAQFFLEETIELRSSGKILLILDGYAAHVQYRALKLFRDNNVIVQGLPAHTSHVLQPLDKSVFRSFKQQIESELSRAVRRTRTLDAFDVAEVILNSYSKSVIAPHIKSGFRVTGIWDQNNQTINPEAVENLTFYGDDTGTVPTVEELVNNFNGRSRALVNSADVEDSGTIRVRTTNGTNLTSEAVLAALQERDRRRSIRGRGRGRGGIAGRGRVRGRGRGTGLTTPRRSLQGDATEGINTNASLQGQTSGLSGNSPHGNGENSSYSASNYTNTDNSENSVVPAE